MAGHTITKFTDKDLKPLLSATKPQAPSEQTVRGEGSFIARARPIASQRDGKPRAFVQFYYRYRKAGRDNWIYLGRYDPKGVTGITLKEARERLRAARGDQIKHGDVKGYREREAELKRLEAELAIRRHREELDRLRAEEERTRKDAQTGTLRQLLAAYVKSLRDAGKVSADAVEGIFKRNVLEPFPELADRKANAVLEKDVVKILNRMYRKGIRRHVNTTRSYLRAAYAYGLGAHLDFTNNAQADHAFNLTVNPADNIKHRRELEKVGERALSAEELRSYWKALDSLPLVTRCALRFNLALACQRPTQLLRAKWKAFDFTDGKETLLLNDAKGKGKARDHMLPLTGFAIAQLAPLREANAKAKAGSPFTTDGKRVTAVDTLSHAVREVSDALTEATKKQDAKIQPFQLRDLRRTAETMLQKLGVDREVRAHLLSHGRTQGVQGKHYERYDFLPEKRQALEKWARELERIIEGRTADVVPITAAGGRLSGQAK